MAVTDINYVQFAYSKYGICNKAHTYWARLWYSCSSWSCSTEYFKNLALVSLNLFLAMSTEEAGNAAVSGTQLESNNDIYKVKKDIHSTCTMYCTYRVRNKSLQGDHYRSSTALCNTALILDLIIINQPKEQTTASTVYCCLSYSSLFSNAV